MFLRSFTISCILLNGNLIEKIITTQTDWGGEYEKLQPFFQKLGITHHVSCPHAHQQNGSAKRKHRHIVEVGLALLAHASMPLKFWDEDFLTATFLINLLPSKVLNFESPTERLLSVKPNYDALRIFGCACWPNLRPYNNRKLSFRSKQCVFLGYSPRHKGVKCLDVSTGRVYISRDVVFDKNVFPFATLHPNAGSRLRQEILLLPSPMTSHSPIIGVANTNDHMHNVVPITLPLDDAPQIDEAVEENLAQNDALDVSQSTFETDSENAASGATFEVDAPEHSPGHAAPDGLDPGADSPATSVSASEETLSSRGAAPSPRAHAPSPRAASRTPTASSDGDSDSPVASADADQNLSPGSSASATGVATDAAPDLSTPIHRTRLQQGIREPKKFDNGIVPYGKQTNIYKEIGRAHV